MAYVGTPSRLGSARDTLASIIQGEAGGEGLRGMQAVAQVISNRAAQNYSGYGSDLISQATARMQFQGQSRNPSAAAYQVADQALAGNLPNVVGSGAVNYANPGDSSARWARNLDSSNSYQVGNHYFTDNTRGRAYTPDLAANGNGAPGGGVNANGVGPGSVETSVGTRIQSYDDGGGTGQASVVFENGPENTGTADTGTAGTSSVPGLTSGTFPGLGGLINGLGQQLGLPPQITSALTSALGMNGAAGAVGALGGNISGFNAAGPVQASPGLVSATQNLVQATQQGDRGIQQGVQQAGQTIGQAITSQSQSWQSWAGDTFLRLAFIVTGLVLFGAALWYFARPQVQQAASAVADVIPAGRVAKAVGGLARRRGA